VNEIASSRQNGVLMVVAISISIFWELGRLAMRKNVAFIFYPEDGGRSFHRNVNFQAKRCRISEGSNLHVILQGNVNYFTLTEGKLDTAWAKE
jgi:hypothetical protein